MHACKCLAILYTTLTPQIKGNLRDIFQIYPDHRDISVIYPAAMATREIYPAAVATSRFIHLLHILCNNPAPGTLKICPNL